VTVIFYKGTTVCTADKLDDLYIRCNEYQNQQLFAYAYLFAAKKIKDINNICGLRLSVLKEFYTTMSV